MELMHEVLKKSDYNVQKHNSSNISTIVSTTVAYLIGIEDGFLSRRYDTDTLHKLEKDINATNIRNLCILRMAFFKHYNDIEYALKYDLQNLDKQKFINQNALSSLINQKIFELQYNTNADKYFSYISKLIDKHIQSCETLFPIGINFDYIRILLSSSEYCDSPKKIKEEINTFNMNSTKYPYKTYINWDLRECGNLLANDVKFLTILYSMNNDQFESESLYCDITDMVKQRITDFVQAAQKAVIVVDCENCDPYKFYGMLKNLSTAIREHITKIVLYDDVNTSPSWEYIGRLTEIEVEHVQTQRVTDNKSVVDIEMMLGISNMYYKYGIDSVIVCSSDSDFCPLVRQIPDIAFMVLYEPSKCGGAAKAFWEKNEVLYVALDNFFMANATELRDVVLKNILIKLAPQYIGSNAEELADKVFMTAKIFDYDQKAKNDFVIKYIKKLKLVISKNGDINIEI